MFHELFSSAESKKYKFDENEKLRSVTFITDGITYVKTFNYDDMDEKLVSRVITGNGQTLTETLTYYDKKKHFASCEITTA